MSAQPIANLTAMEAVQQIAQGQLSSAELVSACLEQIAAQDGEVAAFQFIDAEHALAQARRADAWRQEGRGLGPLHGVPVAIKDIIDTCDMPTENGCAVFKDRRPETDAACVAALRAAGAVILGKTVTTELATFVPAKTRNPRDLARTPGGSSSGSAAAVAAGMAPLALGTQTIGSVIRPASFCGVVGYKPTFGLIPRTGVLEQSPSLDTIGVLARSVEDAALAVEVMQGRDERDPGSFSSARLPLLATATADWPLAPMFTFVKTHAWEMTDAVTKEAFGELVEQLGGNVAEVSIDHTTEAGVEAARVVNRVELAHRFGPLLDKAPDMLDPVLIGMIEEGRKATGVQYVDALSARARFYETVGELVLNYGPILTPSAVGPAPEGLGSTGNPIFCAFWSYLGMPAVTLPLLEAEGLPMGVQLVGLRLDDGRLLRTANGLIRQLREVA